MGLPLVCGVSLGHVWVGRLGLVIGGPALMTKALLGMADRKSNYIVYSSVTVWTRTYGIDMNSWYNRLQIHR